MIIENAGVLFDSVRRYRFAEEPQAVLQEALDRFGGDLPPIADIELTYVVDRRAGKALGVAASFFILEPEAAIAPADQEAEARGFMGGFEYQTLTLAGKQTWFSHIGGVSYMVLFPADNAFVALDSSGGAKAADVINVGRAIARVRL